MTNTTGIDFSFVKNTENSSVTLYLKSYNLINNGVSSRNLPLKHEKHVLENINFNSLTERALFPKKLVDHLVSFATKIEGNKKVFVVEHSQEHKLLSKYKPINDVLGFHGENAKKLNNTPKQKPRHTRLYGRRRSNYKDVNNEKTTTPKIQYKSTVYIDFCSSSDPIVKTNELSIVGYDSNHNFKNKINAIFDHKTYEQNLHESFSEYAVNELLPHIELANSKSQNVIVNYSRDDAYLISRLKHEIESKNIKNVGFTKQKNLNQKEKQDNIHNFINKKFIDVNDLENKRVVYCDGSALNGNLGAGFLIRDKDSDDITQAISQKENRHYKGSNGAETLAFISALELIKKEKLNNKPLYFVFDSDYVFVNLNRIQENKEVCPARKHLFERALSLIDDIGVDVSSLVIKSHLAHHEAITPDHRNVMHYNKIADKLAAKGSRKLV